MKQFDSKHMWLCAFPLQSICDISWNPLYILYQCLMVKITFVIIFTFGEINYLLTGHFNNSDFIDPLAANISLINICHLERQWTPLLEQVHNVLNFCTSLTTKFWHLLSTVCMSVSSSNGLLNQCFHKVVCNYHWSYS